MTRNLSILFSGKKLLLVMMMTTAIKTVWMTDLTISISMASMVKYLTKKLPAVKRTPLRTARKPPRSQSLLPLMGVSRTTGP